MRALTRTALPLLAAVLVAGCGSGGASSARFAGHAASCPRPSTYVPHVSAARGAPGTQVTLNGTFALYDETGKLDLAVPTVRLDVWWNLDPDHWWTALTPAGPRAAGTGKVVRLERTAVPRSMPCTYRLTVTVPQVAPGAYPLTILYATRHSVTNSAAVPFTVTG